MGDNPACVSRLPVGMVPISDSVELWTSWTLLDQGFEVAPLEKLLGLLLAVFKVGALTVGGAAGIFPALAHELVEVNGWLSPEEFLYTLSLGEATPGPAVLGIGLVGMKWAGIGGLLLVNIALVVPGLLWMALVTKMKGVLKKTPWIQWFFAGAQAAVPGLLAALAFRFIPSKIQPEMFLSLSVLTLWLVLRLRVQPAFLILGAIAVGWLT